MKGTTDLSLFYSIKIMYKLVGYANESDPHSAKSQTDYVFLYRNITISWKSVKQIITTTSSNHSEILTIHEAIREYVWLRSLISYVQEKYGLQSVASTPTILYEDNAACIA